MFSESASQIVRKDALVFYHKSEVLVKGVYFCFALETELGSAFRVANRGYDSVIWHLTNSIEQKWQNHFKIEYVWAEGDRGRIILGYGNIPFIEIHI